MKTKQVVLLSIVGLSFQFSIGQISEPVNNIASSLSYVGTSNDNNVIFKRNNTSAGLLSATSVSFGVNAGQSTSGYNTFVGSFSGINTSTGIGNVFLGYYAGVSNGAGSHNVCIGFNASMEENNNGSRNVFIGANAGFTESDVSDRLIIGNGENNQLIWGDFASNQLKFNAKVGIGNGFGSYPTTAGTVDVSAYNLFVTGGILTEEVRINLRGTNGQWADYVFNKDYNLKSLNEVEKFISENGHLPNVPSAKQVKEDGIELGNMAKIQQEKIEELTLYLIQQNKEIEELKAQMKLLLERK